MIHVFIFHKGRANNGLRIRAVQKKAFIEKRLKKRTAE